MGPYTRFKRKTSPPQAIHRLLRWSIAGASLLLLAAGGVSAFFVQRDQHALHRSVANVFLWISCGATLLAALAAGILALKIPQILSRLQGRTITTNQELTEAYRRLQTQSQAIQDQQVLVKTANMELEAALKEVEVAQQRLNTVFASVREGLVVIGAGLQLLYWNPQFQEIMGSTARDWIFQELHERVCVFTLDGQPFSLERSPLLRIMHGQEPDPPRSYQIRRLDGQQRVVQIEAIPLRLANSPMNEVLGVFRDITREFREERYSSVLHTLAHICVRTGDLTTIIDDIIELLYKSLHISNCAIAVCDLERPGFAKILGMKLDEQINGASRQEIFQRMEQQPVAPDALMGSLRTMATGQEQWNFVPLKGEKSAFADNYHQVIQTAAVMPLRNREVVFGAISIGFNTDDVWWWDEADRLFLKAVADEIGTVLQREQLYAETQRLALYDPLTGLHNHRALQHHLSQAIEEAARTGDPLGVIMLDVDFFRRFNETYGHDIGDAALRSVAAAIQGAVRNHDIAARYGGEEFTVILPAGDQANTAAVAERMRSAIASQRVPVPGHALGIPVTASLGYAVFPADAQTPTELLKCADLALYAAKHAGRDCVRPFRAGLGTEALAGNARAA